jgi:hypothetical protein
MAIGSTTVLPARRLTYRVHDPHGVATTTTSTSSLQHLDDVYAHQTRRRFCGVLDRIDDRDDLRIARPRLWTWIIRPAQATMA